MASGMNLAPIALSRLVTFYSTRSIVLYKIPIVPCFLLSISQVVVTLT